MKDQKNRMTINYFITTCHNSLFIKGKDASSFTSQHGSPFFTQYTIHIFQFS